MIQSTMAFSRKHTKNQTLESKEWRIETAYRMLLLLRTSIAVLQFRTLGVAAWEVPELSGQELEFCRPTSSWRRHTTQSGSTSRDVDGLRVPMLMGYLVRESVSSHEQRLPHPLTPLQEDRLLQRVQSFVAAFEGYVLRIRLTKYTQPSYRLLWSSILHIWVCSIAVLS